MTPDERAARMDRVWQKHLAGETVTLDEFLAGLEAQRQILERNRRRAGLFGKLGIRAPQWLYDARHPLFAHKWDGTERWHHRWRLAVIEWVLDRLEMLSMWGRLW